MSDLALVQLIQKKIAATIDKHHKAVATASEELIAGLDEPLKKRAEEVAAAYQELIAALEEPLKKGVEEAVKEYRAAKGNRTAYETSLGAFIVEQNPYASWENIDFPDLPLDPKGENPWVRRSGVLADYNALNPLPEDLPIPGGIVVNFSYADWPELQSYNPNDHPRGQVPPPEAFVKPEAEVALTTRPVPFNNRFYPHNIVKAVRLRYTVFDRRYKRLSAQTGATGRDKQIGFILILYSGGDTQ